MAKKFLTKALVLMTIALTFSFCKKDEFSISAKKVVLTETVFEQSVLKKTGEDEFTLMGYNNDQKLVIIKYNSLLDEIDSKMIDVPSSFALANFLDTEDGYFITSQKLLTKINHNNEIVWTKEPTSSLLNFGGSFISDDQGGVWLNGILSEEVITLDGIRNPSCLMNISNDGTISIIEKYIDTEILWYYIYGVYNSIDKESLILLIRKVYMTGYGYELLNINKDGSVIWESYYGGPWMIVDNTSYFVMNQLWQEGSGVPNRIGIQILDKNGEIINSETYEEASNTTYYTTPVSLLDDEGQKVALVTKQNYQLNFYDNKGVLTKTSSLAGIFPENSIKGFYATNTDYAFYTTNDNGSWLYLIPKNQF